MAVTMKLVRIDGRNADLRDWGFGSSEISKAITKEFEKRIDVFFSENGIEISFGVDFKDEEIVIWSEVSVNDGITYAKGDASITIRELLREGFDYLGNDTHDLVIALRGIADEIEQRGMKVF